MNTSDADIITDFFVQALGGSVRYDRGVGFFGAGWLQVAAEGMAAFARNSGRARWVTSPILSEEDWQALQLEEAARHDEVLRRAIERNLSEEKAAALWDEAYAEESARLDHEPEREARSNVHVPVG